MVVRRDMGFLSILSRFRLGLKGYQQAVKLFVLVNTTFGATFIATFSAIGTSFGLEIPPVLSALKGLDSARMLGGSSWRDWYGSESGETPYPFGPPYPLIANIIHRKSDSGIWQAFGIWALPATSAAATGADSAFWPRRRDQFDFVDYLDKVNV